MILENVVARKDLRTRMRGWSAGALLSLYLSVLGATALIVLLAHISSSAYDPSETGTRLFQAAALAQLALILLLTPVYFSRSISSERAQQTWDLLLMTRLSSFAIVWGKLWAGLAFNLLLAAAALPLFALGFAFRSFPLSQYVEVYAVLISTILLLGSLGIACSVVARSGARAMVWAGIVTAGVSVGLTALILNAGNGAGITLGPYRLSPDWARLTFFDPVAALVAALPNGQTVVSVGPLGALQNPLGFPLPIWGAYALAATCASAALCVLAVRRVRTAGHGRVPSMVDGS